MTYRGKVKGGVIVLDSPLPEGTAVEVRPVEDGAAPEEVKDLRGAIEWMKKEGDLLITDKEVDPDLEITGIQKQLDGGCPILFNNVKGKPHHRAITNLFGDMNVIGMNFLSTLSGWSVEGRTLVMRS